MALSLKQKLTIHLYRVYQKNATQCQKVLLVKINHIALQKYVMPQRYNAVCANNTVDTSIK